MLSAFRLLTSTESDSKTIPVDPSARPAPDSSGVRHCPKNFISKPTHRLCQVCLDFLDIVNGDGFPQRHIRISIYFFKCMGINTKQQETWKKEQVYIISTK
jgi:hypothetical protein